MKIILSLGVLMILASGCAPAGSSASLERVVADYAVAFNARDAAKVASFYTEDGELTAPGASMVKGRAAIAEALKPTFEQQDRALTLKQLESGVDGDQGFSSGIFAVTIGVTDSGEPEVVTGRYLAVFKRVDGDWKMGHHMFHLQDINQQPAPDLHTSEPPST
jgi:uncharacterized protein (TIGR02246 family)